MTRNDNPVHVNRSRSGLSVSVVICAYTRDRWDDLRRAVESVRHQRPVRPAEVIVVADHNDRLADLVGRHMPDVRLVRNDEVRGVSCSRNLGARTATGDIVAFMDDDAAAEPTWLADLLAHYADPQVCGVGGSARPVWRGGARPRWLPREFDWVVGCSYLGQPRQVGPVRNLLGCNMSFRREVFEAVGGFALTIGRLGRLPIGCEETEFCIRLTRLLPDQTVLYDPAIVVHHAVSPDRRAFRYFRRRCYSEGLSKAAIVGLVGANRGLASERAYTLRVLPRGLLVGLAEGLTLRPFGLARAFSIAFGTGAAAVGYAQGRRGTARARAVATIGARTGVAP